MPTLEQLKQLSSQGPLIAPSMLKCDFANLQRDLSLLEEAKVPLIHWDVMDASFVPNLSYGAMVIESVRELTNIPFDAHLMIADPEKYLDDFLNAGCDAITVHIEAVPEPQKLLERVKDADRLAGLALNPGTPIERVEPYLSLCDLVLVMSVEPGFGGQKFIPAALDKLKSLKCRMNDSQLLSVDGGVGYTTISDCAQAGANTFVCGSSIFDQPDYSQAVASLHQLAAEAYVEA